MSPEKMDRKAPATEKRMAVLTITSKREKPACFSLEFVCTDREQAAGFVEKINQEGAGMWIKSLQLEKDETAMKGTMEVVYCHDQ